MGIYTLPPLPYAYDALEPYVSAETMHLHHDKHHQAYVDKSNLFIEQGDYKGLSIEEVIKKSFSDKNFSLFNNVSQHYNHLHFWHWLKQDGGSRNCKLPTSLETAIKRAFAGGMSELRAKFIEAAVTQFGSGWAWIALKDGEIYVSKTPNGENPVLESAQPILGLDVWEHSYYVDYRNDRAKYAELFWDNLVNWDYVIELFEKYS